MQELTNRTFDEIDVGTSTRITHTFYKTDVEMLALVAGGVDAFHIDRQDTTQDRADGGIAAEAAGTGALLSNVLNRQLPGPGTVILAEQFAFQGRIEVGDQLTATVTAQEKRPGGHVIVFECRCVNQHGDTLLTGTATVAAPTQRITYTEMAKPGVMLQRRDAFTRLLRRCEGIPPVTCAVVHPCDHDSLLGPLEAARRGLIVPILVGPEAKIRAAAEAAGVDLSPYRLVSTEHSQAAAEHAVALARAGEVEALMKGSLHTDELMGAVVSSTRGLRTARRISHAFLMDVPVYPRPLLITDAAINIYPTLDDKVDIVQNAIDLAHLLGISQPKVAILSAVETINSKIPSTLDAAALCKMAERGQITGAILDGPLAFDNAISAEAARTKKIVSPVAGQADILLVPDLEAGNMVAKQLQYFAGADAAGIVLGTRVPVVLTSRADSVRTRLASTAVLKLVAHGRRTQPAQNPVR
ncbi:MAG TPA: bifunctional enoyl-CoA hydratase/phosphate acetyltransferase [Candidatus Competibacteraceae bacterium]|nr:bifunctional enoyl-CoA hydratase/phosphate acetyltransferase [Candidatus Competibacteraceae bacterium]